MSLKDSLPVIALTCLLVGAMAHAGSDISTYQNCLDRARQKLKDAAQAACESSSAEACNQSPSVDSTTDHDCRVEAGLDTDDPLVKNPTAFPNHPHVARPPVTIVPPSRPSFSSPAPITNTPAPAQNNFVPTPPRRPTQPVSNQGPNVTAATKSPTKSNQAAGNTDSASDPNPNPAPSQNTSGESADTAQTHADSDIATCSSMNDEANRCCNNPTACMSNLQTDDKRSAAALVQLANNGPASGQSINDYCAQLNSASAASGNVNTGLAAICATDQSSCKKTCTQMAQKYQSLLDNCDGCAAYSVYQETLASLQGSGSACDALKSQSSKMAQQGLATAGNQGYAQACQNLSASTQPSNGGALSAAPSSAFGATSQTAAQSGPSNPMNDPYGCLANPGSPACQDCTKNPNGPTCRALSQTAQASQTKDQAGFAPGSTNKNSGQINVTPSPLVGSATLPTTESSNPIPVKTVANNSGGGIPGAGSAGSPASLAGGAAHGSSPGSPGFSTDIDQGTRSGGYSQKSDPPYVTNVGGFSGVRALAGQAANLLGMDLRQFLPGGRRDPGRQVAGLSSANAEINGKGVDLFMKISVKMEEKCKLGLLWECQP